MDDRFERYTDTYEGAVERSIGFVGQSHDFFTRSKASHLLSLVKRHLGAPAGLSVLDVGCGVGLTDSLIAPHFASVHGVDVSEGAIERAADQNPGVDYRTYDGRILPFADESLDVTFAICVLHHVDPSDRAGLVGEMKRVTRPGGLLMIFEHNPVNPLTRLAVGRCEFDEGVVLLSQREVARLCRANQVEVAERRYILFLPWAMSFSQRLDRVLGRLPLGAQHVVVARGGHR